MRADTRKTAHRKPAARRIAARLIAALSWLYLLLLCGWFATYLVAGDRIGYLGLINLLAVYLFFPLPLVFLAAVLMRSRGLQTGVGLGVLVFLWLWGALFIPRSSRVQAGDSTLTAMTFNVLAWHEHTAPILATIRAENPDVVFLQELNWTLAGALQGELSGEYPFQVLEPQNNPSGIGVISRYPLQPAGEILGGSWIGGPMVLSMDWNGQKISLVNFHMYPTLRLASEETISRNFRVREEQAQRLADFARQAGPVILGGDANSVPLSDAYKILARDLNDAWREEGFGLGHTFPGSDTPGGSRPKIGSWYVPRWLARIDYIFYSGHWEAVEARLARVDGVSDHRGVVAALRLAR